MVSEQVQTTDGISWYTETFHPKFSASVDQELEHVVLVPSGEGDCQNLVNLASLISTQGSYQVLTFDMPGFSRTLAPVEAYSHPTPELLAKQIITLLDQLQIPRASFFGCSSGGIAVLAVSAFYPERVKCAIIHEVPFDAPPIFVSISTQSDDAIVAFCQQMFANNFIEQDTNDGRKKWEALGSEYHTRLEKNFVTWMRGYVGALEPAAKEIARVPENLQQRPIFWTVGEFNQRPMEEGLWGANFELAKAAGLHVDVERLKCLHFPAVTITEETASWIVECVRKVQD